MYSLRPYARKVNASVVLVSLFILFAASRDAINSAFGSDKLSLGTKDLQALLNMCSAVALSAFIIKGLMDINRRSLTLHSQAKYSAERSGRVKILEDAEKSIGTLDSALRLGRLGIGVSYLTIILNILKAGTTIAFNHTLNPKYTHPAWLAIVLIITNLANWGGFVLLNILGSRNFDALAISQRLEQSSRTEPGFATIRLLPSQASRGCEGAGAAGVKGAALSRSLSTRSLDRRFPFKAREAQTKVAQGDGSEGVPNRPVESRGAMFGS